MVNLCKNISDTFQIQNGYKWYDFNKCLAYLDSQGKNAYGQSFEIQQEDLPIIYKLLIYAIKDKNSALELGLDTNKGIYCLDQLVAAKRQ